MLVGSEFRGEGGEGVRGRGGDPLLPKLHKRGKTSLGSRMHRVSVSNSPSVSPSAFSKILCPTLADPTRVPRECAKK